MKEKKTNGMVKLTARVALARIWKNFKEHPIITTGAVFTFIGTVLTGGRFLSGCVKTPKEPVKPPYEQTVPSGEIPSGLPGISSGDITSGNPQLPSGDITSGDVPPSGEIGSGEEKPEKPTNPTEPEKPAVPGDENYNYPTTMEELEASPDKVELQRLLTNYIDENLKEMIAGIGYGPSNLKNTETLAYDIDVENNKITGFYNTELELKNQYYITESHMKDENRINLAEILKYQAQIENQEFDITAPKPTIQINIPKTKTLFTINITKAENEFQPYAKDVFESITSETNENAIYFAENMGAIPEFNSGFWPVVRTTVMFREGNTFKIKYFKVVTKDYASLATENKKEYKVIDNSETEFTFGSQNTIFAEDLTEEEKNSVIVASVEGKPYAIIDKNQTYYME